MPEGKTLKCAFCDQDVFYPDVIVESTSCGCHVVCIQKRLVKGNTRPCPVCSETDYAAFLGHLIFVAPVIPDGITYIPDRVKDHYLRTFWSKAVAEPNSEALKRMITIGISTETPENKEYVFDLLALSSRAATFENMKFLLDSGLCLFSKKNEVLSRGFAYAIILKKYDNAALFLQRGLNINEKHEWLRQDTLLTKAVIREDIGAVKFIIEKKADLNIAGQNGRYPIHIAVDKDNAEIVELLMKTGQINLRALDSKKRTPIQNAVGNGKLKALKALFDNGADPEVYTSDGFSTLQLAIMLGPLKSVEFLMHRGSMPITRSGSIYYALHMAVMFNRNETIKYLVNNGADPNEQFIPAVLERCRKEFPAFSHRLALSDPPIVLAIIKNNFEVFKTLLEAGTDVNRRIFDSTCTLLHLACEVGNEEMAAYLIESGADMHALDSNNRTPFFYSMLEFSNNVTKKIKL